MVELLALLAVAPALLKFHPPTLVGPGSGYASNFVSVSPSLFIGDSENIYMTTDTGQTWRRTDGSNGTSKMSGVVGSAFSADPVRPGFYRNLGWPLEGEASCRAPCHSAHGVNDSWYSCYTCFSTPAYASFSQNASTGELELLVVNEPTRFTGLPNPVSLRGDTAASSTDEHDFGRDGGGATTLSDGTVVLTLDVRWSHDRGTIADAARAEDLTLATNVIAMRSHDSAKTFSYTASLCEASKHRGCGECCNENDIVTLGDGKAVMSVWRMGAGDGLIWNKSLGINGSYHFYNHAVSRDGGETWSPEAPLHEMGCAKPELLRVSPPNSFASSNQPVVLGGGRLRNLDTSDILLWESSDGMGENWQEYSVSYWHDRLATGNVSRFTKQMNSTKEPRQSSSYVSLLDAGPGEFVVVYDQRKTPVLSLEEEGRGEGSGERFSEPDSVFAMRVTVDSSNRDRHLATSADFSETRVELPLADRSNPLE